MALQTSGAISLSNVNVELGRSSTAQISLGETAVRNLAGVASGAISLSNLYGKSNVSFTPSGGTSAASPEYVGSYEFYPTSASILIACTQTATWTWTRTGASVATASVASGGSASSITFSMPSAQFLQRSATFTVSATAGGITRYWVVQLDTEGLN